MRNAIVPGLSLVLALALAACGEPSAPAGSEEGGATATTSDQVIPEGPERVAKGPYAPRNECLDVTGAKQFLIAFERAVKDRDDEALLSITDANVKLDFGGGAGLVAFRERLADPEGKLWEALDRITMLGCASDSPTSLTLPWYFAQNLGVEDPFTTMLVTGEGVAFQARPVADGKALGTISWDVVELVDGLAPKAAFQHVRTQSGKEGYIASDQLRSLLDYRLSAERQDGEWRIVSFVAGD